MKRILMIGLFLLGSAAFADIPVGRVISDGSVIYDEPIRAEAIIDKQIGNLALGEGKLAKRIAALEARAEELERKVAGMQKQITILHAKKADVSELQHTRDQVAHIFRMSHKEAK